MNTDNLNKTELYRNKLSALKDLFYLSDNSACFIERERFLNTLDPQIYSNDDVLLYAKLISGMLSYVSTPVNENDIFVGRVEEGKVPEQYEQVPSRVIAASGHMSFDYGRLLKYGLKGILERIKENSLKLGDEKSRVFYESAEIVVNAIRSFAKRYSEAAAQCGMTEAATALRTVPYEGAYDLFSALQGMWIIHMIASCYIGSRDYAFGKFDEYLYPYYKAELEQGKCREELDALIGGFFIKTNEICGRTSWNYRRKPIMCNSSKQYVNIGGEHPNELSQAVLDATMLIKTAQPSITVLLKPDSDAAFTDKVFQAQAVVTDVMNVYNYDLIKSFLLDKGLPNEIASDFTYSACCTFDLHNRNIREEYYLKSVQAFCSTLNKSEYGSVGEILEAFTEAISAELKEFLNIVTAEQSFSSNRKRFSLDALLIGDCVEKCRYPMDTGCSYHIYNVFFSGVATIADSLAAIDRVVFKDHRLSYHEFMEIVNNNFNDNEEMRREIVAGPHFGNDTEADVYATLTAQAFINAVNSMTLSDNSYIIPGFYSLDKDNRWATGIQATPDGRLAGTPFSENQSPSYGADRKGITALLNSVTKLCLERTATGGLNLTFAQSVKPEILKSLVTAYFMSGGLHVGISVLNREELEAAMINPEKYRSLTVRLYGFSEYFVSMPKWQQFAILNRTAY